MIPPALVSATTVGMCVSSQNSYVDILTLWEENFMVFSVMKI